MPKKPHPVEYHDAGGIAQAVRYDVALFLGRGRYAKASVKSLVQAKKAANKLAKEHESRFRPLIYPVTAGRLYVRGRATGIRAAQALSCCAPMQQQHWKAAHGGPDSSAGQSSALVN